MRNKNIRFLALLRMGGIWYVSISKQRGSYPLAADTVLAAEFDILSRNGNSSCSATFTESIDEMSDAVRLQGSCCSSMDKHHYTEQITGLTKYKDIPEIPSDPYDIDASLAKKLEAYYDLELTPDQQMVYDYAMQSSMKKGPCCCKCWRWYVYRGLGKLLIQKYNFTGEQVTEIRNLSDGCGGAGDHVNH